MKTNINLIVIVLLLAMTQCGQNKSKNTKVVEDPINNMDTDSYSMDDFKKILKIDTHVHVNTEEKTIINMARANNFKMLNVAVAFSSESLKRQIEMRLKHYKEDPEVILFCTAFSLEGWDDENWADTVIERLKVDFENGAIAVKTWKNIGMEFKDKDGNLIVLNDPKFDPVFQFIADQGKVLLSHAGEPKNCWLPLDSMTVGNDREYFKANPQYHMYLHPDMPSYEEQIRDRDNRFAKHPDLKFLAVHVASLEWSVDEAAKFLDRFPNASVDFAERLSHTQYQSQRNRKKVRDFFIKYQDRILYGSDFAQRETTVTEELEKHILETWENDWRYLNTDDKMTVPQLNDPVQGLKLPKKVVDKIYRQNAEKLFPAFALQKK